MRADLEKMARCIELIRTNKRISVRRLQEELNMSRSSTYRWISAVSKVFPLELENGIVKNPRPERR